MSNLSKDLDYLRKQHPRNIVTVMLYPATPYGMDFDKLVQDISEIQKRAKSERIERICVRLDYEEGYYREITPRFYIQGTRPETDEEWDIRLSEIARRAAETAADKEAKELALYERLKKKYEGPTNKL